MKPTKALLLFTVVITSLTSCKKDENAAADDWRSAYTGLYIGTSQSWYTDLGGNTTGPLSVQDTFEVKLGPYPDKLIINEKIFLLQSDFHFEGQETAACDSVNGAFTSGSMHYQLLKECNGTRENHIFLGSRAN